MYSESKFTHWSRYDPHGSERSALPKTLAPTAAFAPTPGESISLYQVQLHKKFLRPFTVWDVVGVLATVPPRFLSGLQAIYLLGGTTKQETRTLGGYCCYGAYDYSRCEILLFAFPRRCLHWRREGLPEPHIVREYQRAGARVQQDADEVVISLDEAALKSYYLHDVLLHEIGHHVDCSAQRTGKSRSERFANWFAEEHGYRQDPRHTGRRAGTRPRGTGALKTALSPKDFP